VGGPESGVKDVDTTVSAAKLTELMDKLTKLPSGFHPHPKIEKILEQRRLAGQLGFLKLC